MLKRMMLKWLAKEQIKDFSDKMVEGVQSMEISGQNLMLMEMIVSVAQLNGVTPKDLAEQITKRERFGWFMNELTLCQIEQAKEMMSSIGEDDITEQIEKVREKLEKEIEKHADKTK